MKVTTMKVIIKIIWAQEVNNEYNKPCSIKNQYRDEKKNKYSQMLNFQHRLTFLI